MFLVPVPVPEYFMMGHVNELTDAFSFGIVLTELLSDLNGVGSRGLLEVELEVPITAADLRRHECVAKHSWPERVLETLGEVVEKCTEGKRKRRGTVMGVLPQLEALL